MTRRSAWMPALGLVLALLAPLAVAPVPPARAQGSDTRARIAELEKELAALTERMTQMEIDESRLAAREAELEKRVDALKQAPPGVVRDAELQTALRELRSVLAQVRNMNGVEDILVTTLRTRQVDLMRTTAREATRLIQRGEQEVHAGDDDEAMHDFSRAFTYLARGQGSRARNLMGHQQPQTGRLTIPEPIPVTGRESPDELREMALILRDAATKLKSNARVAGEELARFSEERGVLLTLQRADTAASPSMQMVLRFLNLRIAELEKELAAIRNGLSSNLAAATVLERRARQYEAVLLGEPQGPAGGTP